MVREIAVPDFSGGTREAATIAAIPSVIPCGRPVMNRTATRTGRVVERIVARLPRVKTAAARMRSRRRSIRGVSAVKSGAPTTTPIAYALTAIAACGIVVPRSWAIHGSRVMEANSVVPTAKPPAASAVSARPVERGAAAGPPVDGARDMRTPIRPSRGGGGCGGGDAQRTAVPAPRRPHKPTTRSQRGTGGTGVRERTHPQCDARRHTRRCARRRTGVNRGRVGDARPSRSGWLRCSQRSIRNRCWRSPDRAALGSRIASAHGRATATS